MSRQMKNFADYFMQGMQLGAGWAEKWQAQQIAKERNRLMGERQAAVDKRENAKLGLYGEQVRANADLARARAYRAMNPVAKGGGGAGATANPGLDALTAKWAARDGMVIPSSPAPTQNVTNNYGSNDGSDGGSSDAPPPVEGGYGDDGNAGTLAKGGMVKRRFRRGRKFAEGGIVGGMSLQEAQSYQGGADAPRKQKPAGGVGSAFSGAASSAASKYKTPEEKKTETPDVTPRGPAGSGAGGSYTTADLPTLTAGTGLGYRAGGPVRRFDEGGAVSSQDLTQGYDYKAAEKEREARGHEAKTEQAIQTAQQGEDPYGTSRSRSRDGGTDTGFASSFASAVDGSANGATGSGGDSAGGVSGTGGVGGSATGGAGGSAAAGTSGDAGSDGSGTYRQGGRVRRFQSGGRVMEAIDTGTSGPGSGYGYRAAPPANARRY